MKPDLIEIGLWLLTGIAFGIGVGKMLSPATPQVTLTRGDDGLFRTASGHVWKYDLEATSQAMMPYSKD